MKHKNKLKEQKAITLIALVITIVVMLILAGVIINLTLGENGIFTTAQKAAQNYTDAQNKELAELADFTDLVDDTINGVIRAEGISLNKTSTTIGVNWTETLTATITPNNTTNTNLKWTSSDESVATVENGTITGIKAGTTTITVTSQDESKKSASCEVKVSTTLSELAKPGDYVEYDGENGYTGLWQVLYNDSTYGLQIISAENVLGKNEDGTDIKFTLGGSTEEEAKASYNNAVNILNAECRKYVNTSYAKDENSGRCVGSNPLSPDDDLETMEKVTLQFKYNGSTESGCVVGDTVTTSELDDYKAMKAATNQNDDGIHDIDKIYWIASRSVDSYSGAAGFAVRHVNANGNTYSSNLWYVDSNGDSCPYSKSFGLRPVITLASDIQTSSGDGSDGNVFKLVAK